MTARKIALDESRCRGSGADMKVLHIYRTYSLIRLVPSKSHPPDQPVHARAWCRHPDFHAFAQSCARTSSIRKYVARSRSWAAPRRATSVVWTHCASIERTPTGPMSCISFRGRLRITAPARCRKKKPSVMTYHSDIVRQRALGYVYGPLMRATYARCRLLSPRRRICADQPNSLERS